MQAVAGAWKRWRGRIALGALIACAASWPIAYAWPKPPLHHGFDGCPIGGTYPTPMANHLWEAMFFIGLGNALLLGLLSAEAQPTAGRRALCWAVAAVASVGLAILGLGTVSDLNQMECFG
jgi:hypothetical protein